MDRFVFGHIFCLNRYIFKKNLFGRDTKVCSKLLWNTEIFMFKILLHILTEKFSAA